MSKVESMRKSITGGKDWKSRALSVGFALMQAEWVAMIGLFARADFGRMNPEWMFNFGADIVGISFCCVMYYGCKSGGEDERLTPQLFAANLSINSFALFLDACGWFVQGIPELRVWNRIVNVLYYLCGLALPYLFWLFVHSMLRLNQQFVRRTNRLFQIVLIPFSLLCLANLFVPIYFSVDEQGVYRRQPTFPISYGYSLIMIIIVLVGMVRSHAPRRQLCVVATFIAIPALNAFLTFGTFGISTQYIATLISILLIYSVLFAEQSKMLTATETELGMAAAIQTNMLPNSFPAFPSRDEFEIYATMEPAKEVGGDFYDFFMVDEDHLAMVVADVSGKGVPAALFSMIAKTMLKMKAQEKLSPEETFAEVNASLCENNEEEMFVTVWLGVLELSTGELTYADAGHERLLLYQNGTWSVLPKAGGIALAALSPEELALVSDAAKCHNRTIRLRPGDAIFQYTDGVTEAVRADQSFFGEKRLLAAANSAPSAKPKELLPHIRGCIDAFVQGAEQNDDITMLALRLNAQGKGRRGFRAGAAKDGA